MKFNALFFLMLLICSLMPLSGNASSAGDDDSPPPEDGGSAGGGGGSPQYFDYYVPLIFSESSKYGESQVIIWTYTSSAVITTFSQDGFGRNVVQYQEPTKLIFTPSMNEGLTNGSQLKLYVAVGLQRRCPQTSLPSCRQRQYQLMRRHH